MPTRLYKDYIKVDPNFIPVFSSSSDRTYPDKWQSFYPHDSFKTILTGVVEMLEKGSAQKDTSQWMSGSYGTGKTYASFTIKHILEDPIEAIEPYFTQNKMQSLLLRVKGVRSKGDILVVHKSSSAGINSQNKLFGAITASVRDALKEKGYAYLGSASRYDKVLATLKDPNSSFNFSGAFQKYHARFTEYETPDDVVEDLETLGQEDIADLLDIVIGVAEDENYNWSDTPEEIINWLEDVRKGNQLYAIVFMWDEFTEFFRNNQNNITGLQEIAMASSRISFYFFLITHSDVNQLISDQGARKILQARFKQSQLRLGENTALTLLGQALRHSPDLQDEWEKITNELTFQVNRGVLKYIGEKDFNVRNDDFINLFPMHPYASYLLKFIAQDISSNQRTMFQFMSGDYVDGDAVRTNFRWFIDNNGYEYGKWNLLTVDYLWDYFFNTDNVDLDRTFLDAISHYSTYENLCADNDQKRVFKVVLLLAALNAKNGGTSSRSGATSLLRPTQKNITACFVGTPLAGQIERLLSGLTRKGALGSVDEGRDTLYVMTTVAIDQERMDEKIEETRKVQTFERVIADSNYNVAKSFRPEAKTFIAHRCEFTMVTPESAASEAGKVRVACNKIPVFYMFARNEQSQGKAADAIGKVFSRLQGRCVIVDFTSLPFTEERYSRFIESRAREKYFEPVKAIPHKKA